MCIVLFRKFCQFAFDFELNFILYLVTSEDSKIYYASD